MTDNASPRFSLDHLVTPDEIDEVGHVSNVVYVSWVLKVAKAHSDAVGWDYDGDRDRGQAIVVRRHEIDYLRPAMVEQTVRLTTWVPTWKAASCVRNTEIHGPDGETLLARASTRWAFIDMTSGRPIRIPDSVRALFAT